MVFRGKYVYESDTYQERDSLIQLQNASPGSRTVACNSRSLGNLILEYVSALPNSVPELSLIFSTDEAYEKGYSKTATELQQVCACLPNSVTNFNLNGIAARIHPSNLPAIFKALRQFVTTLSLEHTVFHHCPSSMHKAIFLSLNANLMHLSLAFCNLHQLTTTAFVSFFNGLSQSKLKSLNLGFNNLAQKPIKELAQFLSRLPKQLEELSLAGNHLSSLGWVNLVKVLAYAPKTIKHLDLSDNKLLLMPVRTLKALLHSLSPNITSLLLCEQDTKALSLEELIARFTFCLPERIHTLSFKQCNLLGRTMADFSKIIKKLPQTVLVLDFNDNDLSKRSKEELICLFSKVPSHVRKIKLNRNALGSMSPPILQEVLSHLPPNIELDLSDNGFEALPNTALNQMLDGLPDGIIHFGNSRLRLKNNGSMVVVPSTSSSRQETRCRHQKEFALLQLVLVQMVQYTSLPFDMLQMFISYIFPATTCDVFRMMEQLAKTNTYIPATKTATSLSLQEESKRAIRFRLNSMTPKSTSIQLNHCALFRLKSQHLIAIFNELPTTTNKLNLKGNGFLNSEWSKRNLFEALKHLPPHIKYVDLSDNGFEKMSWEELTQLLTELPNTLLISLNHEKPISPKEHIQQRNIPAYYQGLIKHTSCSIEQARILLDDYSKGDSVVKRFFSLHWFRKHSAEVTQLVSSIDYGVNRNIDDLLSEIENIPKNASGSLGKRWMYLFQNSRHKEPRGRISLIATDECKFECS